MWRPAPGSNVCRTSGASSAPPGVCVLSRKSRSAVCLSSCSRKAGIYWKFTLGLVCHVNPLGGRLTIGNRRRSGRWLCVRNRNRRRTILRRRGMAPVPIPWNWRRCRWTYQPCRSRSARWLVWLPCWMLSLQWSCSGYLSPRWHYCSYCCLTYALYTFLKQTIILTWWSRICLLLHDKT